MIERCKPRPIVIDTDRGIDDALAIAPGLRSPELRAVLLHDPLAMALAVDTAPPPVRTCPPAARTDTPIVVRRARAQRVPASARPAATGGRRPRRP